MNDTNISVRNAHVSRESGGEARGLLAEWWQICARDLPWRFGRTSSWGVLVSEVMSQQTQMSRVVPYWNEWMERWPDAASLADASKADVIAAWGRLGYPRRALRLQECARVVGERYQGELPQSYEGLTALPGIGDYTASAVLSFAFGRRAVVVDTNIRRVLSRVFLGEESLGGAASAAERALAERMLPDDDCAGCRRFDRPSVVWNQSVMELGAVVCTAKNPLCERCPISGSVCFWNVVVPGWGSGVLGLVSGSRGRIGRFVGWCWRRCVVCRMVWFLLIVRGLRDCGRIMCSSTVASHPLTRMV